MFDQAPQWISRSPRIRKLVVKIWRAFLRVQRATLAKAVLIARRSDDRILAVTMPSGKLTLPSLELDGGEPIGKQVQAWAGRILQDCSEVQLQAVDGTPGRRGVVFVYSTVTMGAPMNVGTWVDTEVAPSAFPVGDRRLLLLCE